MHQINAVYRPFWETDARYRILVGGAGSGKSVTVAQRHLLLAATTPNARILTIRKVAKTCRHSTFQLYKDVLEGMNRISEAHIEKSPMRIGFPSGGEILHVGLDDEQKLKSIHGITHLWIEEATELDFPDAVEEEDDLAQLDLRLRGVPSELDPSITLTFNPVKAAGDIYEYVDISPEEVPHRGYIEEGDAYVQHTTHKDNPFVGEEYLKAFRHLGGTMRKIYVEGEMARTDAPDQVIPYEMVQRGKELEPKDGLGALGADVARYGQDDTVLARIQGNAAVEFEEHSGLDTGRIATILRKHQKEMGIPWPRVSVDAVGIGAGVVDQLPNGVVAIKGGASPVAYQEHLNTRYEFYNLRSQLWWVLREALDQGRLSLPDPPNRLVEDLCAPRYSFQRQQKIRVESKEDIKERLGRSPDYGDALGYGWAVTELMIGARMETVDISNMW